MNFRRRCLGRSDFLELGQRAQAGWLGLARAAAGGGQHCENGSDKCGNNADHGVEFGRFYRENLEIPGSEAVTRPRMVRTPGVIITSSVSHRPACSVRERRSGSRRRREMRRRRRSKRFSSVGRRGWWFANRHEPHASLRARLAAGFLPARQNTGQKPDRFPPRKNRKCESLPRRAEGGIAEITENCRLRDFSRLRSVSTSAPRLGSRRCAPPPMWWSLSPRVSPPAGDRTRR